MSDDNDNKAATASADITATDATVPPTITTRQQQRRNALAACCYRYLPEFLRDPYERKYFFLVIMTSPIWRFLMFLCILLMLFGYQVQTLWIDRSYDNLFDILYTLAFVVFCLDIILRILVVPGYVSFKYKSLMHQMNWKKHRYHNVEEDPEKWGKIRIGSFLFWCDVISTACLLYDISYINTSQNDMKTNDIELDQFGIPKDGQVNRAIPITTDLVTFITIGKTIRAVRFVRSSHVANIVGKVNWYWPVQILDPRYLLRTCKENRNNGSHPNGEASSPDSNKRGSGSRGPGSPTNSFNRNTGSTTSKPERSLLRQQSWGGLGMATLAAVKAHKLAKEEQQKQAKGLWGKFKRFLWNIGILRNDKAEWQRQLAATKIQRAWRKVKNYGEPAMETDPAWQENSVRKSKTSSAKALRKHSLMKHYSALNKHDFRQSRQREEVENSPGVPLTAAASTENSPGYFDESQRNPNESQVGSAMRELTGQRVAFGIIITLVLTVLFTYSESDATRPATMIVLHTQTSFDQFANISVAAAQNTSVPDLYRYDFGNGLPPVAFGAKNGEKTKDLRNREILRISVVDVTNRKTIGWFSYRNERVHQARGELLSTLFIILIWLFAVTAFAGPVMVLVVLPIERMVRLLGMLMLDPLGYQSTSRYKKFVAEENVLTKNTRWTKEVLKGMETSFLMSTILRIGSLMKVGFGSAGVEIIRKNLEKKEGGNVNLLTSQGTTVSCIFLFCDIRQFTDATECLQEEVFVFTNRIAAVVHSFCHSYGGSANKNIGDAFLCSWLLDDPSTATGSSGNRPTKDGFFANNNQADKCLLCVVKVLMALHHDTYYIETMNDAPRNRLLEKLSKRPGPIVQMGFGLHAGKAVQGAIGSERKIDATYVSEAVEMAEFLESSTKKYGVNMLMSDCFHRLLHSSNRYRCRIVDQIVIKDNVSDEDEIYQGDIIELYTYDVNIDALWEVPVAATDGAATETSDTESFQDRSRRDVIKSNLSLRADKSSGRMGSKTKRGRRMSLARLSGKSSHDVGASEEMKLGDTSAAFQLGASSAVQSTSATIGVDKQASEVPFQKPELVLPTGPALYNANIWRSEQMLKIRAKYSDGLFFHKFNSGLQSFYAQDWDHAKQCFQGILDDCLDDGPSKYFLEQIKKHNGKPPSHFRGYGIA